MKICSFQINRKWLLNNLFLSLYFSFCFIFRFLFFNKITLKKCLQKAENYHLNNTEYIPEAFLNKFYFQKSFRIFYFKIEKTNKENKRIEQKIIFISQQSPLSSNTLSSAMFNCFFTKKQGICRTPQNSHQPQSSPLYWQNFYHQNIFTSLERENGARKLSQKNRMREETIQTLTFWFWPPQ